SAQAAGSTFGKGADNILSQFFSLLGCAFSFSLLFTCQTFLFFNLLLGECFLFFALLFDNFGGLSLLLAFCDLVLQHFVGTVPIDWLLINTGDNTLSHECFMFI